MDTIMEYVNQFTAGDGWQKWVACAVILIVGILIAYIARGIISSVINRTGLGRKAMTTGGNIGSAIGKAVFWLILLYTLYLAISPLDTGNSFNAINNLIGEITAFAPKLLAAGLTTFIGYIVAKVAGNATSATLEAAQVDNLATAVGVKSASGSKGSIANSLGKLVFIMVIVPVAIVALDALQIEAVSGPLSSMLSGFLDFIPTLIGAALILTVSIFIGRFISNFLQNFLPTLGFDNSINEIMMLDDGEGLKTSPSKTAGYIAFLIVLVIGLSATVNQLGNASLSNAFGTVQEFGGSLLRAAILIAIGVFLANFIGRIMSSMMNPRIADFVKYAAMVLFIFLGLSSLDPAGDIVPVAFSAFVIAAAVAGAVSFGLGGRDWAAKVLNNAFPPSQVKKVNSKKK